MCGNVAPQLGRRQADADYARFAFTSATRMITRLPSARAARVFGMRSGRIFSLASLIIAPEALHSHAAFLNIRGILLPRVTGA